MTRPPHPAHRRSAPAIRLRTLSVSALAVAGAVVLLAGCSSESAGQPTALAPAPSATVVAPPSSAQSPIAPSPATPTSGQSPIGSQTGESPSSETAPTSGSEAPPPISTPTVTLPPQSTVTVVVTDPPTSAEPPVVTSTAPQQTRTLTRTGGEAAGGHDYAQWSSPTGNIACAVADGAVRCDIMEITYTPPKPADCSMGVPRAIVMSKGDAPAFVCISDTVMSPDAPVLEYGESTTLDGFTCTSEEDGMHCTDDDSGATFRLARGSYDLG